MAKQKQRLAKGERKTGSDTPLKCLETDSRESVREAVDKYRWPPLRSLEQIE